MTSIERLLDLLDRIEYHAPEIFIREKVNGTVGNYALSELPTPLALDHVCRWIRKAIQPVPIHSTRMEDEEGLPRLGACCNCGIEDRTVRNVIMLSQRSPEPGIGCWGCLTCDLEQAGAVAVLCDACLEESHGHPKSICLGSPGDNRRLPIQQLDPAVFDHDRSKHADDPQEIDIQ